MRTATVVIRDRQWQVWVAASPAELIRGLAGVHSIPRGTGMLLALQLPQPATIDTRQLRFPIDVVFIDSQLRVVNVARNVQPGALVTEQSPVWYVLEVNATETAGIEAGDPIGIAIHQSPMGIPADFVPQLLTVGIVSAFVGGVFGAKPGGGYRPPIPPGVSWREWEEAANDHLKVWDEAVLVEDEGAIEFVDHIRAYYPDDIFKQISMVGAAADLAYYALPDEGIAMGVAKKWGVEEAFREIFIKRLPPRKPPEPRMFPGPLGQEAWPRSLAVWVRLWGKYLEGEDGLIRERVRKLVELSDDFVGQVMYAGVKWGPKEER